MIWQLTPGSPLHRVALGDARFVYADSGGYFMVVGFRRSPWYPLLADALAWKGLS